jgi:hypothetical protein
VDKCHSIVIDKVASRVWRLEEEEGQHWRRGTSEEEVKQCNQVTRNTKCLIEPFTLVVVSSDVPMIIEVQGRVSMVESMTYRGIPTAAPLCLS